jgi:hypothetical protein
MQWWWKCRRSGSQLSPVRLRLKFCSNAEWRVPISQSQTTVFIGQWMEWDSLPPAASKWKKWTEGCKTSQGKTAGNRKPEKVQVLHLCWERVYAPTEEMASLTILYTCLRYSCTSKVIKCHHWMNWRKKDGFQPEIQPQVDICALSSLLHFGPHHVLEALSRAMRSFEIAALSCRDHKQGQDQNWFGT